MRHERIVYLDSSRLFSPHRTTRTGEQTWIGFDADGILRRLDFGLSRYVPLVGDEIAIHITVEAHAE
jgi:polyisoprenoid-binding protein YceI